MANTRGPSFVKKGKYKSTQIPGTKASLQNPQLLVSSGIHTFDNIVGGGLPVGSITLIDEDVNSRFSNLFLKYFLSEGIASEHALHVCSADEDPKTFVQQLPGLVKHEVSDGTPQSAEDEKMTIAWRYQNMKLVSSSSSNQLNFGHHFDLTKSIDENQIKNSDISYWSANDVCEVEAFEKSYFGLLLQSIKGTLENGKFLASDIPSERKILRLGLVQIGTPIWSNCDKHLPIFMYCLRALLRNSFSTCMISVPFHLYQDKALKEKCIHLSDLCVQLQSFSGTPMEQNPALSDYNGFFRILKWAAINGLINGATQPVDLAIKLRRRKMVIEKLHLPPELEDSVQREQDSSAHIGCGSSKQRLLEF